MPDVLVPLDGSELAEQALPLAELLAQQSGGKLRLLQAMPPIVATPEAAIPIEPILEQADDYLKRVAARLADTGVQATTSSRYGFPTDSILEAGADPGVGLIVMSTQGRTGLARAIMGSVAENVLRQAEVPVFLVPAAAASATMPRLRRIVVPLDGSALAHTVVEPALELARRFQSELILVEVLKQPEVAVGTDDNQVHLTADEQAERERAAASDYLRQVHDEVTEQGVQSTLAVRFGEPAAEIIQLAEARQADAIVLSTHGRTGLDRVRHGSVAEDVLRHSKVPVMTLGQAAIRARQGA